MKPDLSDHDLWVRSGTQDYDASLKTRKFGRLLLRGLARALEG